MPRPSPLQSDLFGAPQGDLFAGEPEPVRQPRSSAPDPADIRRHIAFIVGQAWAAETMPWDDTKLRF